MDQQQKSASQEQTQNAYAFVAFVAFVAEINAKNEIGGMLSSYFICNSWVLIPEP